MEREVLFTGIGGQGVQLAARVLARAATLEGRYVSSLGVYGGMMRGGNTDSTLIVADAPILAPPIVPKAWAAIAMHDEFFAPIMPKLRSGGVVFVNDATFATEITGDVAVVRVAATHRASELGSPLGGSLVMVGAFVAATGFVEIDAAIEAMRQSIPTYRTQHIASNEIALRAGCELATPHSHSAWEGVSA
jgi:2-oxoacid:acceptor oxidoreductase gamma subunit (pyruvate/2-ketoisovalerate family)